MNEELEKILHSICLMFNESAEVEMAYINSPKEFVMDTVGDIDPSSRRRLIRDGWVVSEETEETKRISWSLAINN